MIYIIADYGSGTCILQTISCGACSLDVMLTAAGTAAFIATAAGLTPDFASRTVAAAVHSALNRWAAPAAIASVAMPPPMHMHLWDVEGFDTPEAV